MRDDKIKRVEAYVDMIQHNDTKGCPDPVGGGCMGHYCTTCAVRAIKALLPEIDNDLAARR